MHIYYTNDICICVYLCMCMRYINEAFFEKGFHLNIDYKM